MDSSGHIYDVEADMLFNKSPEPVPDPMRGVLVMKALEAAPPPPSWWPELAPLTAEERRFVLDRLGRRAPAPEREGLILAALLAARDHWTQRTGDTMLTLGNALFRLPAGTLPAPPAAPAPERAPPKRNDGRCSLCGSPRVGEWPVWGACTLVPGRDGKDGCPDPMYDVRLEEQAAPTQSNHKE